MGRLRILTPGIEPAVLELTAEIVTLGRREENELCLPDPSVSGRHCQLAEADGTLTIMDLGSTNGSFIKGERVEQGTVAAGETFLLGSVELCYELGGGPAVVPVPTPAPVVPPAPALTVPATPAPVQAPAPAAAPAAPPAPGSASPAPAEAPKLPSLPKLVVPPSSAKPPTAPAAPTLPKLDPAEALRQSLAKAGGPAAPKPAPAPEPKPAEPAPSVRPPGTPGTPGSVKPPEPGAAPKLVLGGGHASAPTPAAAPAVSPPAPKPAAGNPKLVPTGEPSKLTLGGHGKTAAAPAAPVTPAVVPPPSAPKPSPPGMVVPTGGPSKLSLGGGHKAAAASPSPAPPTAPAATPPASKAPAAGGVVPTGAPSKFTLGGGHKAPHAPAAPAPAAAAPAAATPAAPAGKTGPPCTRHPGQPVKYVCKRCHAKTCDTCSPATEIAGKPKHFCPLCKNMCMSLDEKAALDAKALVRDGQTFRERLPGVFKYPFHKGGLTFLIIGTIVFVALDFVGRFSMKVLIVGIGYLFAYMQRVVQSSALAEDELPGWPEISEWQRELLRPFLLLAWTFIVSFGPAFAYMIFHAVGDTEMRLPVVFPLFALGFLYFPMALLAVSMSNSYLAVNPLVVLPAITRLNLEYVAATAVFFGLVAARYITESLIGILPIPVLPTLVSGFLALYFLTCEMRLLGLMYYEHKKKLGWFTH